MPVITCHISANDGPGQYLEDLTSEWWNLQREDRDTDLILATGENSTRVHQAVLLPRSPFLRKLVPLVSCDCFTPTVILPSVEKDSLSALVELFYTGRTEVASRTAQNEVEELMVILQIGVKDQDEKMKDTVDQNEQSERKTSKKVGGTNQVERNESIDKMGDSNSANKEVNISQFITEVSEQTENNNVSEGSEMTDLLDKTTRGQKRKIGEIVNENNQDIRKHKKKRLDLSVNNNVIHTDVDLARDVNDMISKDGDNFNVIHTNVDLAQDVIDMNSKDGDNLSEQGEIELPGDPVTATLEEAEFICPFCSREFVREVHYKNHLSLGHFKKEISDQFTGLDCDICKKSFLRKSSYVCHLGSAHKIIDGLMDLFFDVKVAQMREDNHPKALANIHGNGNNFIKDKDNQNSSNMSHMSEEGATISVKENDETSVAARSNKEKQELN